MQNAIRHFRQIGLRLAGRRRLRWLPGLLVLGFALLGAGQAAAAETPWTLASRFGPTTIPGLTMRLVSDTLVVLDSNKPLTDGPDAGFHAVRIVNTGGTTVEGVRARLDMAGAGFTLAGSPQPQRASQYVGRLSPGDSVTVFWFVGWPRVIGATGTATITLTDASAASLTRTDNLVVYSSISSGTGGQIFSIGISSSDAVGALISTEVTYEYGNTQVGDHFQLNPAGNRDFNAGCFQLVRAQVVSSFVTALPAGLTNTLYTEATVVQSGSNKRATVKYTYRSLCVGQQTFADPYASQTSGATNYKYSGNYGFRFTTQPYFPPGTNNFTIAKTVPDSTARQNEPVRFDVIVNNPYGLPVVVDSIVDQMPPGAIFDSVDATSDVTVALSSRNPLPGDTGRLVFVGEPDVSYSIPANSAIRLKYWVRLSGPLASYTNRAAAYTNQIQLGNVFASATVRTVPSDLSVAKTLAAPASPTALDTLTYTILTRNAAAVSLPVTLTDSLPAGVTFLSASRSATVAGRLITWPAYTLAADTERIDTVRVIALTAGSYINVARISRPAGDDDSTTNRSAVTTAVGGGQADLAVTKARVLPAAPLAGDTLVYTITTTNLGPKPATGVTVTDSMPAGLVYVSASNAPTVTGRQVVWGPFSLAIGASRTDTLRVAAPLDGTYFNVARVAGAEADPDTTNNRFVEASGSTVGPRANLGIAKVRLGSGLVALGDTIAYQLTVTNAGPSAASGIIVADTLPAGLTFKSASRTPTVTGQEVRWAAFALASGASRVDTIVVTATASGSFSNVAGVQGTEPDPDLGNNRAVHTPAVQVVAVDLRASKVRVGSGEATVGDTLQWALTVENVSLVGATEVVMRDSLPTGYTFVSATGSPTVSGREVLWGSFSLAAGASRSETIRARATLPGTFTNVIRASSPLPDATPADNRAVDSPPIVVNPASGLAVSKVRVTSGPFYVGDTISYTLSVQNAGPDNATNVRLVDSLPSGLTFLSASGSPTVTGRRIEWPPFSLAATDETSRTIAVVAAELGTWANIALVSGDQPDPNTTDNRFQESPGTTVLASADLSVVKIRLGTGPFLVGDTIAYRIVTTNAGPSPATGIRVVDTLPSGYGFRSATNTPTVSGQVVQWAAFSLAVGASRTDTVVVNAVAAGTFANTVSVAGDQVDRRPADNRAVETPATTLAPRADLSITKARLGSGPFYVGDTLRYVLTSRNQGPSPATGITVTDVLPAGYSYVGATNAPGVAGQTVTWGPFGLAAGASRADTVRVRVTVAGSYANSAVIAGAEADPDTTNNRATETPGTTVLPKADLSILKTRVSAGPFYVNDVITYTVAVQNAGPSPATGVTVIDTLPTGYTFVSGSNSPTVTGQVVAWGPFTLASGASRLDTLRVRATAGGTYRNAAAVAGAELDPAPENNRHVETGVTTVDLRADLSVSKTRLGTGPFYVGQTVSYVIRTDNAGPSGTTGLVIADTLPLGLNFVSATGSPTVTGREVRWGPLSLAAGAFRVDTLVVQPTIAGTFVNAARVSAPEDDLDPTDNRDTEDGAGTTVLPRADLSIAKTRLGSGPFYVGDLIRYTLQVANAGPSGTTGLVVTDTLPAGYQFVSATGSPTVAGRVLQWGPLSLAAGASRTDTLTVRATTAGTYVNAASVDAPEDDPDPADDRDTEDGSGTTVALLTNLVSQTSVVGPAAPRVGDEVTLVVRTWNEGPSRATGVLITDSLPLGVTFSRATGSPAVAGRQLQWGPVALDSGAVRVDTIVVVADVEGSLLNVARAAGNEAERDLADNRSTATFLVGSASADLLVSKRRLTPTPLVVGDDIRYEITIQNSGPAPATGVRVTDTLPAGLTFLSGTNGPTVTGQVVVWGPLTLAAGAGRTDTVRVRATAAGSYANTAVIAGTEADPDPGNNRATEPTGTVVGGSADLSIVKTRLGNGPFYVGDLIRYTLQVANAGPSGTTGAVIVDTLQAGYDFVTATGSPAVAGRVVRWGPISLAAGATRTDTLTVRVTAAGTYLNSARVSGPESDPDPTDNRDTEDGAGTTVLPRADLSIAKTRLGSGPFYVGDTLRYVLTSRNQGPSPATGITVTDVLPAGYSYVGATNAPGVAGQTVTWGPFGLAAGASRADTVRVRVTVAGSYANSAVIAGAEADPDTTNNRATETPGTTVSPLNNLVSQTSRVGPAAPRVGDEVVLVVRTRNEGPSRATGVVITDSLPAGVSFGRATGSPAVAGRQLQWGPIVLDSGAVRVDTIVVVVTAEGSWVNVAHVTGNEPERDLSDNRSTVTFLVGSLQADLSIAKMRLATGPFYVGDTLRYVLTSRNDGPSPATGVLVVDTLPAGLTFLTGTNAPSVAGRVVQWGPLSLAAGASRTDTLVVRADAAGSYANTATITGAEPDPDPTNNRFTETPGTTVAAKADLSVLKTRVSSGPFFANDVITYALAVRNAGPSAATGVRVTDTLPAGYTFVSGSNSPTVTGQVVVWGPFTLASGASRIDTLRVRVTAEGTYRNAATVAGAEFDPALGDNRHVEAPGTAVGARADLSILKTRLGSGPFFVGDTIRYALQVANAGPSGTTGLVMVDTLPAGYEFVSATGSPAVSGRVVQWGPLSLAAGASRTDTLAVRVTAAGTYVNAARVDAPEDDPDPTDDRDTEDGTGTTVAAKADLSIAKVRLGSGSVLVGDTVTYALTVRNQGPSPAAGVEVVDSLPQGMRFVRASRGGTAVGRIVTWPTLDLGVGAQLVDSVRVVLEVAGELRNVATVRSSAFDPNQNDNVAIDRSTTTPVTDLRITKALARPLQPEVGDTLLFVIRTTNAGPLAVTAAQVIDSLPASVQLARVTAAPTVEGQVLRWTAIQLAPGASRTDSVWVVANQVGRFVNIAVTTPGDSPSGPILDPDLASNRAVLEFTVGNTPKLFLAKRASGSAERGGALTFDLLLRNDGPGVVADSLFLVDTLPAALVYQGASAPGWSVQFTNRIFSARRAGPLAERDSLRIRLFTRVADNAPSQFENSATAGVIPSNPEAIDRARAGRGIRPVRASTGVITLLAPDGIELEITGDRDEVEVMEVVNYTARLVAVRTIPDPTMRLGIVLPAGFRLMPGTIRVAGADQSRVRGSEQGIQLPLSGLLAGTPVTVSYQARPGVEALRGRGITNAALANPESPELARDSVRTLVRASLGQEEATLVGHVGLQCPDGRRGVPGVRLVLQDGREVRTDAEGRYSLPGLAARPMLVRVDEGSLPASVRLVRPRQAVEGRDGGAAVLVRPMYGELVVLDLTVEPLDAGACAVVLADTAASRHVAPVDSAVRPTLLLSAMVQARAEAYDRADSLGRVVPDVLDMNIKELAAWNADSSRRGAVRGALYLEGTMGEGRNVTLRVDTERPHLDRFFNDLRPDELYPLLGDAATTAARAQARGRVFGELTYDGSTARFGDFLVPTPEGGTIQLGRYPRVLSGAMASTQVSEGMVAGWASRTTSRFMVDEFRADESTGLLQLRRANAVLWSETVELVTLDRAHPGVILTTERLQRFVDYSVEPGTGRLVLRRLVPGYDEAMNPLVIRVSYEVDGEGERGWVYGGAGDLQLGESGRAGFLIVRDDDPLQRFQMASAGASMTFGKVATLGAEFATSDLDGLTGVAGRLDLQVATGGFRLTGRYQDVGADFRNPAAGIMPDRREAALLGTYRIDAFTSVGGEYYRSALRSGRDAREGGQLWVVRKFGESLNLELGLRRILAGGLAGDSTNSAATNQDGTAARLRMRYAFDAKRDAAVTGEVEAGLSESMPSRGALGFGMRVFDKTRVFVSQEINTGTGGGYDIASASRRDQTVIGFQSEYRPGQQAYSEYRIGRTIDGRTAASVVGLRNTWRFNDQLAFTGLAERQATATGTGYAVGGGAEYRRPDRTDASVRAEYRVTPAGADNFFATAGLIQRAGPWASMLAQTSVGWQPEADLISARSRAGMVFRRGESTTMLVARYEHHYERSQGVLFGERIERTVHLLSAHGTVPLDHAMRVRGQVATKFVRDAVGQTAVDAQASLVGLRLTREIGQRLDLGLAARLLGDGRLTNGLTSYGIEAGYEVASGIRAALGYNVRGFRDKDLAPGATTQRGLYFDLILTATEALLGSRP